MAETFGAVLRQVRESAGMTQTALAEKAQFSQGYIGDMERDAKMPTIETVQRLAIALGVHSSTFVPHLFPDYEAKPRRLTSVRPPENLPNRCGRAYWVRGQRSTSHLREKRSGSP